MIRDIKKHKLFFALTTLILFISFAFNFFGAMKVDDFISNYKDSESLVINQVVCEGEIFEGQLAVEKGGYDGTTDTVSCVPTNLVPYSSQYGLQGRVYATSYSVLSNFSSINPQTYLVIVRLMTALTTALVFAVLTLWVRSKYGLTVSVIFTGLIVLSPMIVGFSRNLYWALPLFILPLIFILYFYVFDQTRKKAFLFWAVLGFLLYLRFLCGYEYVTTIAIMIAATVAYHLYIARAKIIDYIKQIALAGLISVLAFIFAVTTHVVSLNGYTGSTSESIGIIMQTAGERTANAKKYLDVPYTNLEGLANDHYQITDMYFDYESRKASDSRIIASLVAFSGYMLLPVLNLPIGLASPFSIYIQSMGAFLIFLTALYCTREKWLPSKQSKSVRALFLATVIGLVGYFSWLVLGYSHSLVHAHINGILMYLPFALFGYIIIGVFAEQVIRRFMKSNKK